MLNTLDIAIIGSYLVVLLFFGFWYHLRSKKSSELMDGGRNLPGWMVGLSLVGTTMSSIALFSFPAITFKGNWVYFAEWISLPLAAYVAARIFVGYFRKAGHISAYTHLKERVGTWASLYAAFTFIAYQTVRIGFIMFLVSNALSFLMDWDFWAITLVTGVVVTAYTYLGGIRAVVATDILQSALLLGGVAFLLIYVYLQIPGDLASMLDLANAHGKFNCIEDLSSLGQKSILVFFIYGFTDALRWRSIDQACVQRYMIAESSGAARSALWLHVGVSTAIAAILFLTGTALFVFYQNNPDSLAAFIANPSANELGIVPYFIASELPVGLVGLMIMVILAAAMSSLDTEMNSSATLVLKDVYPVFKKGHISERKSRFILTSSAILQGMIGMWISLQFAEIENVYEVFIESMSVFSGGIFGLFLLIFLFKRPPTALCLVSLFMGLLSILWVEYSQKLPETLNYLHCPLDPLLSNAVTTVTILVTGFLLKPLFKKAQRHA